MHVDSLLSQRVFLITRFSNHTVGQASFTSSPRYVSSRWSSGHSSRVGLEVDGTPYTNVTGTDLNLPPRIGDWNRRRVTDKIHQFLFPFCTLSPISPDGLGRSGPTVPINPHILTLPTQGPPSHSPYLYYCRGQTLSSQLGLGTDPSRVFDLREG